MAFTDSDLAAIRAAIAKGELMVQFADRSVRYRDIGELKEAEQHILRAQQTPRSKQISVTSSKGLC